jgi:16S rRNA (guanine527-N7)-methyltransferase
MPSQSEASESVLDGFESRFQVWAPTLGFDQIRLLRSYLSELLRFNKKLNLISPATAQRADTVHILDAVRAWTLVAPHIPSGQTVHDFGSGNGLPGIVAAILAPDLVFRLVDRDQRKVEFLKHVGAALGLKNVVFCCQSLQDLGDGSVDFAISRGFASVANSLIQSRRLFSSGGVFYMMKGEGWSRELAEVQPQVFRDWSVEMLGEYELPESPAGYVLLKAKRLE